MTAEMRAELPELAAAARLANHIERLVAAAPPLTPAQRARLAALLNGGAPGGQGDDGEVTA